MEEAHNGKSCWEEGTARKICDANPVRTPKQDGLFARNIRLIRDQLAELSTLPDEAASFNRRQALRDSIFKLLIPLVASSVLKSGCRGNGFDAESFHADVAVELMLLHITRKSDVEVYLTPNLIRSIAFQTSDQLLHGGRTDRGKYRLARDSISLADHEQPTEEDFEALAERRQVIDVIRAALGTDDFNLLVDHHCEGVTLEVLASQHQTTVSAITSRLFRIRQKAAKQAAAAFGDIRSAPSSARTIK